MFIKILTLVIVLVCSQANATIFYSFDAEGFSNGAALPTSNPGYNFCQTGCSGSGTTGVIRNTLVAPQGTKYIEWITVSNQSEAYTEMHYGASFPLNLVSGKWYYLAYYKRFERIEGRNIWSGMQADKGIEMRGNGIRWIVSRGSSWGTIVSPGTGKWTIWPGNPTYHLNGNGSGIENADNAIPLNQSGYSASNPVPMEYERWYSVVFGIKISSARTGEIKLWLNGVLVADYPNIITAANSSPTIDYLEANGTIGQPGYNSPAHKRQFDAFMLTDNFNDVAPYMRDPVSPIITLSSPNNLRVY